MTTEIENPSFKPSEVAFKHHEINRALPPRPRQFSTQDVVSVQNYLRDLHDTSIAENCDLVPSITSLYNSLTEGPHSREIEPRASEDSFDKTVNTLLSMWGSKNGLPKYAPRSLQETLDLFAQNPRLNERSPIYFQGGAEYATARFVHVLTGRAMGKHREPSAHRYYLNPRADKMGLIVDQLTGAALEAKIPLYFKFIDVATSAPDNRTLERNDRIIIYTSEAQTDFVENLLADIADETPEAFSGRQVAGFGEVLADGITHADEVTKEQNDMFKGSSEGTSFNEVRAQLIQEAMLGVTADLVTFPEYAKVKVGRHTIRQIFTSKLSEELRGHAAGTIVKEDDPTLLLALRIGLSIDRLRSNGFGEESIHAVQRALDKTARDVLPYIKPDDLLRGFRHHIAQIAPMYGVNPTNLARNVPITA